MLIHTLTRLIACIGLWGALWLSTQAQALGLGEPRLVSQHDPHWVVEVPLLDLHQVKPDQIQVKLAPTPSWQAAGLEALDPQNIRLALAPSGDVVRIEITAPAGFLDLLIELQWPRGRVQRELGVLLGPSGTTGYLPHVGVPGKVWVQEGDTASQLVAGYLGTAQNMAQGLLALQQTNPEAFVGGNVNRLRAGAVLRLPSPQEVRSIDPLVASEVVAQQIEEFAMYRAEVAAQSVESDNDSSQVATGKVQPAQRDSLKTPGDRLTLSAPGANDPSDQIAERRQAQQTADRAAELNRNIQDLNRLAQSGNAEGGAALPVPEVPNSALIDELVDHPLTPWAALGLVLLLLFWTVWRAVRTPQTLSDVPAELSTTPLTVSFDLEFPRAEDLPPLPPEVLQPPTPAHRHVTRPEPSAGPGVGANPIAGLSLELTGTPPGPDSSVDLPTDPWALRLTLAQALWQRGQTQTALVLARDVASLAPADIAQQARLWLDERI